MPLRLIPVTRGRENCSGKGKKIKAASQKLFQSHLPVAVTENEIQETPAPYFTIISNQSQIKMHPRCLPRNAVQRGPHRR